MQNHRIQLVHEGRLQPPVLQLVPGPRGGRCGEGTHVQEGRVQQGRLQLAAQRLAPQLLFTVWLACHEHDQVTTMTGVVPSRADQAAAPALGLVERLVHAQRTTLVPPVQGPSQK